jgi:hypothetical protein
MLICKASSYRVFSLASNSDYPSVYLPDIPAYWPLIPGDHRRTEDQKQDFGRCSTSGGEKLKEITLAISSINFVDKGFPVSS